MKTALSVLFFSLYFSCVAFADNSAAYWQKGNSFYGQKQYDSAAIYYEAIAGNQPDNAVLYYNLGNTYYRLNNIGKAVLNYERALRINPGYKEAKDNLVLTENRISNNLPHAQDIFFVQWWHYVSAESHAGMWAVICLILFLSIIFVLLFNRTKRNRALPAQVTVVLSLGFIVCLAIAVAAANNANDRSRAVVMQAEAPCQMAEKGKGLVLLPEGTVVKIVGKKNGMDEVQLPDGRKGTMQDNQLNKI